MTCEKVAPVLPHTAELVQIRHAWATKTVPYKWQKLHASFETCVFQTGVFVGAEPYIYGFHYAFSSQTSWAEKVKTTI